MRFSPQRSRDLHLVVAGMPIFSERYWQGRDFEAATLEAPLGSGPYKVGRFETGRFIEFDRVPDYWAKDLPVQCGPEQFRPHPLRIFPRPAPWPSRRSRTARFNYQEEFTSRIWSTGYDFPSMREGHVKKETIAQRCAGSRSRAGTSTPAASAFKDPRIREAIGLAFDFEWTQRQHHVRIVQAHSRRISRTRDMKAEGMPSSEELALLSRFARTFRGSLRRTCHAAGRLMDRVRTGSSFDAPTSFCARPGASAKERCSNSRTASRLRSSSSIFKPRCSPTRSPFRPI